MNTKFKKALSDLLINPGRTALVIFAWSSGCGASALFW